MSAKKVTTGFQVTRRWQIAFIAVLILGWLTNFWYLIFWGGDNYVSLGTWIFQINQILLPFVWFLIALWYVWQKYSDRLQRLFAAAFLTFLGFGLFSMLMSIEQSLRYRFYPPVIVNPSDDSLLTAFGHEWLVQGIGLAVFVLLIVWLKLHKRTN